MTWGHAISSDLVSWSNANDFLGQAALERDMDYDKYGVFTGNASPMPIDGRQAVFYSSSGCNILMRGSLSLR